MGKLKVLHVDDEQGTLFAMKMLLHLEGIEVVSAENGHSALEMFKQEPEAYDAVITDFNMPGMNGLELCRNIKAISKGPVFLCSGSEATEDWEKTFDAIFPKPLKFDLLLSALRGCRT